MIVYRKINKLKDYKFYMTNEQSQTKFEI